MKSLTNNTATDKFPIFSKVFFFFLCAVFVVAHLAWRETLLLPFCVRRLALSLAKSKFFYQCDVTYSLPLQYVVAHNTYNFGFVYCRCSSVAI